MNICLVMGGDETGGLETHFADLANGLAALAGPDEQVAAIAHERFAGAFDDAVSFISLDLTRSRRNPLLKRRLGRIIRDLTPDVVHTHGGKAAHLLAAVRPEARLVGTVHGLKKNLAAYRRFDAVIGVSAGVLEALDHPRKTVIHNGVAPAPSSISAGELRRRFDIPSHRPVTLAVGRLVPVKGLTKLVEVWHEGLGQLLILGDGPQRGALEALATGKPVTLVGFQADARALMGGADLLTIASEREGFSYTMVEALHARLPVVSTPVPGALDFLPVSHIVPPDDLGVAIARCLRDLEAARERMRDTFDWAAEALTVERMAEQTRDVYDALRTTPC